MSRRVCEGENAGDTAVPVGTEDTTTMWQELPGQPEWRIQTDDPAIARKLSRKVGMMLVGVGVNCFLRVYRFHAASRNGARRTFSRVTGLKPIYDADTGLYSAKTRSAPVTKNRRAA
ncbi:hypothetical protein ACFLSJ_00755 [Verrucomicrobiota bacterium]